ncbi:hypothetical protein LMG27952_03106 [Paraburkholderia hiiakae]|uniref:Uncharacterized protein n=2 Tax=Paraburkholderia hiiakae TaxID=1081782 RepID=A0ABM8NP66_9BURK|nr:hypothetical protein LMG27952_03106 [Paraburkholderia hiiakae]
MRQVIDQGELLSIINDHMESLDDCRNIRFNTIARDPDRANGANWTTGSYRRSGDDHDEIACAEALEAFLLDLQARYDVDWR